ncbi:High-affinity nicotinic acid transporter [Kalmusia sp. IMI 367209]|nr:High-affinity nicotinic acid transporter [Kalmusia sp. IMI 367209]
MVSIDHEKGVLTPEHVSVETRHDETAEHGFVDERKLVLKMDLRILPILVLVYLTAFIDRVNIGNAQLFSLKEDLGLTTNKYNIALAVFFVSYIAFEIPANIVLKKFKPHVFTQRRFSFFLCGATLAGAFGGLLATAIGHMNGVRGYNAWRWIFIIEGLATCVLSVLAYFVVTDFPEDAKWLSEAERALAIRRLAEEQGESHLDEKVGFSSVLQSLTDLKTLVAGFIYFGPTMSGYSLAYFIPTIVSTYGYSPIQSQLYSIPPWAAAFALSIIMAYLSDKAGKRFPFILFNFLLALAGVVTLFTFHGNHHARYAALCLYTMGVFSVIPIVICWFVMNLEGHKDRAVGSAWMIGFGNCAGLVSTFAFPAKDKPLYHTGYSLGIGLLCMSIVASSIYYVLCVLENRKRSGVQKKLLL